MGGMIFILDRQILGRLLIMLNHDMIALAWSG